MRGNHEVVQLRCDIEALRAERDAATRALEDERVRSNRVIAAARSESEQQVAIAQAAKASAHTFVAVRFL
jgi:hypothetical protein